MGTPATSLAKIPVIPAANPVSTIPQVAGVHVPLFAGFVPITAAASHSDASFRDESLKTVGLALKPGTSAIVAITSKPT
jgi:hypothetical protein